MTGFTKYGFLDVELAEDGSNICDIVPKTQEIARTGHAQHINEQEWHFLTKGLTDPSIIVGWAQGDMFREGSYGKIFHAHRMVIKRRGTDTVYDVIEQPHVVVIKKTLPPVGMTVLPAEDITAHISEALLHVLAWKTMQDTATPWSIPRPYEVFGDHSASAPGWRSMSLCMSYVSGRTVHSFLQRELKVSQPVANARILLELLAQIAYILWNLQRRMRLNHRDMKTNNVLIRKRAEPLTLCLAGAELTSTVEVTLIDFGFACVGCPPPQQPMTVLQAGSWFPMGELCCKVGRDIAQFIFCLHCYFPLGTYLPAAVFAPIREWMKVGGSSGSIDMLQGFTKEGRPRRTGAAIEFDTGIYEFLRRKDVDPIACAPSLVFAECCRLLGDRSWQSGP